MVCNISYAPDNSLINTEIDTYCDILSASGAYAMRYDVLLHGMLHGMRILYEMI